MGDSDNVSEKISENISKDIAKDISKDAAKKQLLLRLSPSLWQNLAAWAEDDFRSINGQIEYLLSEAVKQHKKERNKTADTPEE